MKRTTAYNEQNKGRYPIKYDSNIKCDSDITENLSDICINEVKMQTDINGTKNNRRDKE